MHTTRGLLAMRRQGQQSCRTAATHSWVYCSSSSSSSYLLTLASNNSHHQQWRGNSSSSSSGGGHANSTRSSSSSSSLSSSFLSIRRLFSTCALMRGKAPSTTATAATTTSAAGATATAAASSQSPSIAVPTDGDSSASSSSSTAAAAPTTASEPFPKTATSDDFIALVHETPVLVVNFTAQWCKPCVEVKDEWGKLIENFNEKATAAAVDCDDKAVTNEPKKKNSGEGEASESGDGNTNKRRRPGDAVKVRFVEIDIVANETLSALHDVRCVPTYCCYIGGCGGGFPLSGAADKKKNLTETNTDGTNEKVDSSCSNPSSHSSSNVTSSPKSSSILEGSRGLFGTVEGAHLDKVHSMIEAAQDAYLETVELLASRAAASSSSSTTPSAPSDKKEKVGGEAEKKPDNQRVQH